MQWLVQDNDPVFYVPGNMSIVDLVRKGSNPPRTHVFNHTLEEVQKENPGAILTTMKEAEEQMEAAALLPVEEITAERWEYMLNVLPPMNWRRRANSQSFQIMEAYSGIIHHTLAMLGNAETEETARYFEFTAPRTISHEEIITKVQEYLAKEQK